MTSGARASHSRTTTGLLHVLATTDLHCNLLSHDYYADRPDGAIGLSRAATLINRARARHDADGPPDVGGDGRGGRDP